MPISIAEFNAQNQHELNRCNSAFIVDAKLMVHVEDGIPRFTVTRITPYEKRHPQHEMTHERYVAQPEKGIFFIRHSTPN